MPRGNKAEQTAAPLVPQNTTLEKLREAAAGCRACDLWKKGTQTVFGEGAAHALEAFTVALDLAALHREQHVDGGPVAADDLELEAEKLVERLRVIPRAGAGDSGWLQPWGRL